MKPGWDLTEKLKHAMSGRIFERGSVQFKTYNLVCRRVLLWEDRFDPAAIFAATQMLIDEKIQDGLYRRV